METLFCAWRHFPICMSKSVMNNYIEFSQLYDAFGFLLNGHHCTDCYRYTVLQQRELSVYASAHLQWEMNAKFVTC